MEQKVEPEIQAPSEFSNDTLKVKAHFKPNCKIELEVHAAPSIVKEAHRNAIKIVRKEVILPGFRKGKAPEDLVEKNYPKQIEGERGKCIADLIYLDAIQLVKIPLLNNDRTQISYTMKNHSITEGSLLVLFFETEPTIPSIDPKDVTLKSVERPVVNDDKVQETLRQLQLFFAEWTKVDRPIQENDFVILDVDIIEEKPHRKLFADVRFEVTDRSMAKWMKDLILGHTAGETLEGVSVPDKDASKQDQDLTPKKVRVVIKQIEEAVLPELDDTFAEHLGTTSVDKMRADVEKLLNQKADAHVQEKLRENASEVMLSKYKFEVPISLIDREVRFRMQQLLQDQEYLQHWNNMTPEAKKRTVASVAEQSEKAVRMFYLCRKILADAKITISPKDLPKAPDSSLGMLIGDRRDFNPQESTEVHQAEAFSRLLLEKAEDFVISHASIL